MVDEQLEQLLEAHDQQEDLFTDRDNTPENIDHIPADDVVSVYFRQMAAEPLLNAEQEVALAQRIERGKEAETFLQANPDLPSEQKSQLLEIVEDGVEAREHLARANTRLVVSFAKRYRNQGLPMSDLIQEGNIGLMKAVDRFDYTMGNRFSTYASWWIRQTITRALSQKSRTIRLPLHLSATIRKINTAQEIMEQQLSREPTLKELAEHLEMEPDKIQEILEVNPQTIALEMPVGDDSEFGDFLEDHDSPTPYEAIQGSVLKETVDRALSELLPREARIIRLRFGLEDGVPQTLEQVGEAVGLSRERIRQIERQALRRLRQPQFAAMLRDFVAT